MFGESRWWVTALIVAGALVALVLFASLIWWMVGQRSGLAALDETRFVTSSQTTVYVDPAQCPLCRAHGNDGSVDEDETPDVSDEGETAPAAPSSGGFLSGLFSGVPRDLPSGYTARDLSPQFRRVRIASVKTYQGNAAATNADTVTIRENIGSNDGAVNLTGWRVQANQGAYTIQRAAKIYKTTGASLTNVTLANGQSANIYSGASAVNANFMGNSCMGYLNSQYGFVPKLAGSCTKPTKNEIATFSGSCQDYILRLQACQAGDPNDSRIPASDSACRSFVAGLNYDGCVKKHQADEKFLTNVWNVWSGKSFLDPLHDRVLLLDGNGKLVDYYLY